jgi:dihydroorotate dehydrogenase
VVEANLSCPNVGKGQGALYADAQQVAALTAALVQVRHLQVAAAHAGKCVDT